VPEECSFSYALIRLVPRVEREEFINVGAILFCPAKSFLKASVDVDCARVSALAPEISIEEITPHLQSIKTICTGGREAGDIGALPPSSRFHWLTAPRSTIIQPSTVHSGICTDPETVLADLMNKMVRV